MRTLLLLAVAICCCCVHCINQDVNFIAASESKKGTGTSGMLLSVIRTKYCRFTNSLQQQSTKMLQNMQQKEQKLKYSLPTKNSILAEEQFDRSESKYKELQFATLSKVYTSFAHLTRETKLNIHSLQVLLCFIKQGNTQQSLFVDQLKQFNEVSCQLKELQARTQPVLKQELKDKQSNLDINDGSGDMFMPYFKQSRLVHRKLSEKDIIRVVCAIPEEKLNIPVISEIVMTADYKHNKKYYLA